jgi:LacI family transcriptional regulator
MMPAMTARPATLQPPSPPRLERLYANTPIERAGTKPEVAPPVPAVPPAAGAAPGASPATQRSLLVALVHTQGERGLLDRAAAGIADALTGSDLALVLHQMRPDDPARRLAAFLDRHCPAGVVLLLPLCDRDDLAALCRTRKIPCARLGLSPRRQRIACDERAATAGLIGWLITQGHRRIGFVSGPESATSAQQRELGYLDAMAEHGLDRGPALIVPGDNSFRSGIEGARLLLEISPRPTAIVAANDEMGVGVLHAAAQAGVAVPEELSVVGIDDTTIAARTLPTLTSLRIPWDQMAAEAARRIAGIPGNAPAVPNFPAELMIRGSARPLP